MKTIRAAVDRREGELFVVVPDGDGESLHVSARDYDIRIGDVLDITLTEDGHILSLTKNAEETERRNSSAKSRLAALFAKGKKP